MAFMQVLKLCLCWTLAMLMLCELAIFSDAQAFLSPLADLDKYGDLTGSVEMLWMYTTPDLSKTSISCLNGLRVVIIFKKTGAPTVVQRPFVGKVDAIEHTTTSPYRIGFRIRLLAFSDEYLYYCTMRYDGGAPIVSQGYRLKLAEGPRFINCLLYGIFISTSGANYFYVRENGTLASTCYAYGIPTPSLDCRTYDSAKIQLAALTPVRRNYTSYPLANRMVFSNVKRAVTRVRCYADGGATRRRSVEKMVRVDYFPSAPHSITLIESTTTSIKIGWIAPQHPGVTRITDYYMVLFHPNSTITMTNYTVLSWNPILEYTFSRLYPNLKYGIRISAYNAIGRGQQSDLAEFQAKSFKAVTSAGTDDCLATSPLVGVTFGLLPVLYYA